MKKVLGNDNALFFHSFWKHMLDYTLLLHNLKYFYVAKEDAQVCNLLNTATGDCLQITQLTWQCTKCYWVYLSNGFCFSSLSQILKKLLTFTSALFFDHPVPTVKIGSFYPWKKANKKYVASSGLLRTFDMFFYDI